VNALEALNINFKTHHIEDVPHHMQNMATQLNYSLFPPLKDFISLLEGRR